MAEQQRNNTVYDRKYTYQKMKENAHWENARTYLHNTYIGRKYRHQKWQKMYTFVMTEHKSTEEKMLE